MDILRETRLRRPYVVKWKDGSALCIGIAHNQTPEGLKLVTPERIERVKRAMEVDEEPSWHYAAVRRILAGEAADTNVPCMLVMVVSRELWSVQTKLACRNRNYVALHFCVGSHVNIVSFHSLPVSRTQLQYRKAALCYIQQREYALASTVIKKCSSGEATANYVVLITAVHQAHVARVHLYVDGLDGHLRELV